MSVDRYKTRPAIPSGRTRSYWLADTVAELVAIDAAQGAQVGDFGFALDVQAFGTFGENGWDTMELGGGGGAGPTALPALTDVADDVLPANRAVLIGNGSAWASRVLTVADLPATVATTSQVSSEAQARSDADAAIANALNAHIVDASDAHDAAAISFVQAGGLLSTDVQAAIVEVNAAKLAAAEKGAASGVASLNASSRVVQLPADAQSSAALNKIPIAGVGGKLDAAWISEVLAIDGLSDVDTQAFADGDILVRSASKWLRIPRGSALQVLRVNAAGTGHEYATPASGGNPAWAGNLQLAFGNGTPTFDRVLAAYGNAAHSVAGPTPTNIGTAVGRLWEFEVPYPITVNRLRCWTIAAVANAYTLAIYNAAGQRLILVDPFTSVANGWLSAAVAGVVLAAGVYWLGIGAKATGTTSGLRTPAAPVASFPGSAVLPGNLAQTYGQARIAQVALTTGAWPAALPALAAPAWAGGATGSLPLVYLDNNAAA